MSTHIIDVALVTSPQYIGAVPGVDFLVDQVVLEDGLARDAIRLRGLSCEIVSWDDELFDWSTCRVAIIRTTWDYVSRIEKFSSWLSATASVTTLINDVNFLRWNMNKKYLLDLAREGIAIPPTRLIERGSRKSLADEIAESGWTECVLKPVVSCCARHTYRISPDGGGLPADGSPPGLPVNAGVVGDIFDELIKQEDMFLQQFLPSVASDSGEISMMVIGGRYTHAVRKVPKAGDFRVQDDWGGSVHVHDASAADQAYATAVVAAAAKVQGTTPLYARVDVAQGDDGPLLIELEAVEPELWLRNSPEAVEVYADAVAAVIRKLGDAE